MQRGSKFPGAKGCIIGHIVLPFYSYKETEVHTENKFTRTHGNLIYCPVATGLLTIRLRLTSSKAAAMACFAALVSRQASLRRLIGRDI